MVHSLQNDFITIFISQLWRRIFIWVGSQGYKAEEVAAFKQRRTLLQNYCLMMDHRRSKRLLICDGLTQCQCRHLPTLGLLRHKATSLFINNQLLHSSSTNMSPSPPPFPATASPPLHWYSTADWQTQTLILTGRVFPGRLDSEIHNFSVIAYFNLYKTRY